ncbi:MAG: branched-chain amino acid ABC transporter permease [Chloroflexi bacterium]|nr:branched-chain amino acid ABC transporter permease [Chloroflexota bacterium]
MSANIRPSGIFDVRYEEDISLNRTVGDRLVSNGLFLLLLLVPLLTVQGPFGLNIIPQLWIGTISRIAIFAIAVQGLNILVGYTGQISLGHAAFMSVGAYSSAILARELGLSFFLAVPLAALLTGLAGLIFGLPSLRVKGFYLAMATLAAQFIIPWLLRYPLEPLTNGSRPLEVPVPELFGISFAHENAMYYLIIPISVLMMLAARNITRTRVGRAFISIRDNDLAAELLGINVFSYKLQAFFLSALYAGVAGALMAFESNSVTRDSFLLDRSVELLAMLVIGGAGYPLGPLFGVAFVNLLTQNLIPALIPPLNQVLPQLLPFINPVNIFAALSPLLFGLAMVIFLIAAPRGLAHRWEIFKISWKIRPYAN